jgi:hypothetical protein
MMIILNEIYINILAFYEINGIEFIKVFAAVFILYIAYRLFNIVVALAVLFLYIFGYILSNAGTIDLLRGLMK